LAALTGFAGLAGFSVFTGFTCFGCGVFSCTRAGGATARAAPVKYVEQK
jgi:hypothetical protein